MGVAQGYSKIVTSGSVFIYDTGDTFNSYLGEPTTNLVPSPYPYSLYAYASGPVDTTVTNETGTAITAKRYTVTNAVNTARAAIFPSGLTTGVAYTFSFKWKYNGTTTTTPSFSVSAAKGNPEGGANNNSFTSQTQTDTAIGSGWYLTTYTFVFSSCPTGACMLTFGLVTGGTTSYIGETYDVYQAQFEVKDHKTQYVLGTRSATQGLLDISGKGTVINLSSVSFTSTAQPTFDGTDDQIVMDSYASNIPYGGNITVETVVKYNAFSPNDVIVAYGGNNTNFGWLHQYEFTQGLMFGIQNNPNYGSAYIGTTASQQYLNKYIHMLGLYNGSQVQLYINGSLAATQAFSSGIPQATTFRIGNESGRSYYSNMDLPVAKIYNRALSEAEIKQNFDHYKNRFNIASPLYVYSEGPRADLYTANWNNSTTYTMANFGGIANVTAHGWTSGPATYTLTLNQLPPHTKVRYRVYWHLVDSLDNETNQLFIMNSSGTETEILRFTKQYNQAPVFSVVGTNVTNAWSGPQVYTYRPWANGAYNADGYIVVDSGLQDHTATSFTARHVLGADQAQADEAEYLSHVEVLLY